MGDTEKHDVEVAFEAQGFETFDDYLVARTGMTLVAMADELGVSRSRFIVYHSRWIDQQAEAGVVGPLRLGDEEDSA